MMLDKSKVKINYSRKSYGDEYKLKDFPHKASANLLSQIKKFTSSLYNIKTDIIIMIGHLSFQYETTRTSETLNSDCVKRCLAPDETKQSNMTSLVP